MTLLDTLHANMTAAPVGALDADQLRRLWTKARARRDITTQARLIGRADAPADLVETWSTITSPVQLRAAYLLRDGISAAELEAAVAEETRVGVLRAIAEAEAASPVALRAVAAKAHPGIARALICRAQLPEDVAIAAVTTLAESYSSLPNTVITALAEAVAAIADKGTLLENIAQRANTGNWTLLAKLLPDAAERGDRLSAGAQRQIVSVICAFVSQAGWRNNWQVKNLLGPLVTELLTDEAATTSLTATLREVVDSAGGRVGNDPARGWLRALEDRNGTTDNSIADVDAAVRRLVSQVGKISPETLTQRAAKLLYHPELTSEQFEAVASVAPDAPLVDAARTRTPDPVVVAAVVARSSIYQKLPWTGSDLDDDGWVEVLDRAVTIAETRLHRTGPHAASPAAVVVNSLARRGWLVDAALGRIPVTALTQHRTFEVADVAARCEAHIWARAQAWAQTTGAEAGDLVAVIDGLSTDAATLTLDDLIDTAVSILG